MDSNDLDRALATCLEDLHRRRALGETPVAEDYRKRLGPAYADFEEVLAAESVLDSAIEPPVAPDFPQTFNGFTLLRELGRGAMGVVYEAVQRDLGRKVAVKVLRTGFQTEPTALERFRREAKACAQVRHDHIVQIYEAGQWEGQAYYSMAVLEGRSLWEVMREGPMLEPRELCAALAGIASALAALHAKGIVHRDVKPSNIMVEPSGRMVLADFGLARTIDSKKLTTTGHAVGTPLYMSPEQAMAREGIDGRTDVYGLGATLYECLAGQPLFHAEGMADLLRQVLSERPTPVREVAPDVPVDCERIAMMCVERRKEDRYESADALRDDLLAFAEGREVIGKPVTPVVRGLRRALRVWPAIAAVAVGAVGLALWSENRPATLTIASFPAASVRVIDSDSVSREGKTRYQDSFAPGEYEVVLEIPGFAPKHERITLEAGQSWSMDKELVALGADVETLRALATAAGLAFEDIPAPALHRGAGLAKTGGWNAPIVALFPRDKVLSADLAEYRIRADAMAVVDGTLEFRRGDEVLHSEEFVPEFEWTKALVPQSVLEAVGPGDVITWGYYPREGGASSTETFTLASAEEEQADRRLAERFAAQPAAVAGTLQAQWCLSAGLHMAAHRYAEAALEESPDSEQTALARAVAAERMRLLNTPFGKEASDSLGRIQK